MPMDSASKKPPSHRIKRMLWKKHDDTNGNSRRIVFRVSWSVVGATLVIGLHKSGAKQQTA